MNSLVTLSADFKATHQSLATSAGHATLTILAVIGGFAAIQTLYTWITGLGKQRAFNRWISAQKVQQDTGDKKEQLSSLKELIGKLQAQIDNDVPKRARQIYLTNQRDSLAHSLGEQYEEYKKIEHRLQVLTAESNTEPLEKPIKESIERAIVPRYQVRVRQERQVRFLLAVVLILIVVPADWSPRDFVYGYFYTVYNANNYTRNDFFGTILVAGIVLALFISWAGTRWIAPFINRSRHRAAIWIASTVFGAFIFIWLFAVLIGDSSSYNSYDISNDNSIAVTAIITTIVTGFLLAVAWNVLRPRLSQLRPFQRRD